MTQTTTRTQKAQKEVTILSRLVIKADSRKVVYTCLSSDGSTKYETTLFDGKACSCTCPARKPCYHETGCEAKEAARKDEQKMDEMAAYYLAEDARQTARINREMAFDGFR
jgi:hypothetical protein